MFCKRIQITVTSPGSIFTRCESEEVSVASNHLAEQKLAGEEFEDKQKNILTLPEQE